MSVKTRVTVPVGRSGMGCTPDRGGWDREDSPAFSARSGELPSATPRRAARHATRTTTGLPGKKRSARKDKSAMPRGATRRRPTEDDLDATQRAIFEALPPHLQQS